MLRVTAMNRPTEGSMLRAGNGTCGDCEDEALPTGPAGSAGNRGFEPAP